MGATISCSGDTVNREDEMLQEVDEFNRVSIVNPHTRISLAKSLANQSPNNRNNRNTIIDYRNSVGKNIRFSQRPSITSDPDLTKELLRQLELYEQKHLIDHHKTLGDNKEEFIQELCH